MPEEQAAAAEHFLLKGFHPASVTGATVKNLSHSERSKYAFVQHLSVLANVSSRK